MPIKIEDKPKHLIELKNMTENMFTVDTMNLVSDYVNNRYTNMENDIDYDIPDKLITSCHFLVDSYTTMLNEFDESELTSQEKEQLIVHFKLNMFTKLGEFLYLGLDDENSPKKILNLIWDGGNKGIIEYFSKQYGHEIISTYETDISDINSTDDLNIINPKTYSSRYFRKVLGLKMLKWDFNVPYDLSKGGKNLYIKDKIDYLNLLVDPETKNDFDMVLINNSFIHLTFHHESNMINLLNEDALRCIFNEIKNTLVVDGGFIFGDLIPFYNTYDGYGSEMLYKNRVVMEDVIKNHAKNQHELGRITSHGNIKNDVDKNNWSIGDKQIQSLKHNYFKIYK